MYIYTYPIAIGLKQSCHKEVEMKFAKDLELIFKETEVGKCYLPRHKQSINFHAELFASLKTSLKGEVQIIFLLVIVYLPLSLDMPLIYVL